MQSDNPYLILDSQGIIKILLLKNHPTSEIVERYSKLLPSHGISDIYRFLYTIRSIYFLLSGGREEYDVFVKFSQWGFFNEYIQKFPEIKYVKQHKESLSWHTESDVVTISRR